MCVWRDRARGLTLAEILVVLAVVAMMAALAVPAFVRFGFSSESAPRDSANVLASTLQAAKIYAIANHVDTAVVYTIRKMDLGAICYVIEGYAMARKVTRTEDNYSPRDLSDAYVLFQSDQGQFRLMQDDTCILMNPLDADPDIGLTDIEVYSNLKSNKPIPPAPRPDFRGANRFPAHVFTPSGIMNGGTKRIVLHVGLIPEGIGLGPAQQVYIQPTAPVQVLVYPTMGRVNLSDKIIGDPNIWIVQGG